jgi:hypothetical protein
MVIWLGENLADEKSGVQKPFKVACSRKRGIQVSWGRRNEGSIPPLGKIVLQVYPINSLKNHSLFLQVLHLPKLTIFGNI